MSNNAAKLNELEKLRAQGLGVPDCAKRLEVSERTVKRWLADLRGEQRLLKKEIPYQDYARDAVLDRHLDTIGEAQWAIRELQDFLGPLKEKVNAQIQHGELDGVLISSYGKLFDTLTNQLTLLGKLLGQISDAPQLSIVQIDKDVMMAIEVLRELDTCEHCGKPTGIARRFYNRIVEFSERRRRRLPEFVDVEARVIGEEGG